MLEPTIHPPSDSWIVAIHSSQTDQSPLGAGVVIDEDQVITSAHVLISEGRQLNEIWVAFPRAGLPSSVRRQAERRPLGSGGGGLDMALLRLTYPVPRQVTPARLRCVEAADLIGTDWWAFGFPDGDHLGDEARGTVSMKLAFGHIHLSSTPPYRVKKGFSGAGVWCPNHEAVVGLVVSAKPGGDQPGDGRALTLHQADVDFPELKLVEAAAWSVEAAGDDALATWGWALRTDAEAGRHWSPRARGVSIESDSGYRFRGRTTALTEVVHWLDRSTPDGRVLVVTGSPGVGKSAVLGRVVTTSDKAIRESLPPDDEEVRAPIGSVACAVHVKGKTALDVAQEIARAAAAALPSQPEDLVPDLRKRLAVRLVRFNLVVDGLDEAASGADARVLLDAVLFPLARTCRDVGAQVVIGTRRSDGDGDLLASCVHDSVVIDLDDARYFAAADLVAYATATLQLAGAERVGNPYADSDVAVPVAQRIAALAERNFLVAGLVARAHGLYDIEPTSLGDLSFTPTVDATLDGYLDHLLRAGETPARLALTVLAFTDAPGLPAGLWRAGIIALGRNVSEEQLARFARGAAANFIVETGEPAPLSYRLFHQALNEALLRTRARTAPRLEDERCLVEAWIHQGRAKGWADYLLHSLPAHAQRAGQIDDLLADDEYLLHADLHRLIPAAENAATTTGAARALLLQRTPLAVTADPAQRAAMFSVAQTLDHLDSRFTAPGDAPYLGLWARSPRGLERTILEGHAGAVLDVCPVQVGERTLLGSVGEDGTVRIWDPVTGQTERVLAGHTGYVRGICAVSVGERTLVASAGEDGTVRLWDPGSGTATLTLVGHTGWVRGVCAVPAGDRELIASCGDDCTVRLWDPATGRPVRVLSGHNRWVTAVCPLPPESNGSAVLASAGLDGTIRLWDPATGDLRRTLRGHAGRVTALCAVPPDDENRSVLVSAGYDGTVRLWDPATGQQERVLTEHNRPVHGVSTVVTGTRVLVVSAGEDGELRVCDPLTGDVDGVLRGHGGWINGICAVPVGGRQLIGSATDDGTVRLWNPGTGQPEGVFDGGRVGPVTGLCTTPTAREYQLVSAGEDGSVRLWDPATGAEGRTLSGHRGRVTAVRAVAIDGRRMVASASEDRTVRLWNVDSGETELVFKDHHDVVAAICLLTVEGQCVLASGGADQLVRLWNPASGRTEGILDHPAWVTALCTVPVGAARRIVSAAVDGTLRLWEPGSSRTVWAVHGHDRPATAICALTVDGSHIIASAGDDGTIRLWDPENGAPLSTLLGHTAPVTDLCVVPLDGREMLASTSADRTVRLWDPASGVAVQSIPVHRRALACWYEAGTLFLGLDTGILAVRPGHSGSFTR